MSDDYALAAVAAKEHAKLAAAATVASLRVLASSSDSFIARTMNGMTTAEYKKLLASIHLELSDKELREIIDNCNKHTERMTKNLLPE